MWSQSRSEADVLADLFQPGRTEFASLCDPSFLAQVPEARMAEIVQQYLSTLGAYKTAVGASGTYDLIFEKGKAPARIMLAPTGRIVSLWLGLWTLLDDTPQNLLSAFRALDGLVSVCVLKDNGTVVLQSNVDAPLAVGSAFKLYILKVLSRKVEQGGARWEDVLKLKPEWMSILSGPLEQWPAGSPVTLHTLASLMISQSDNTAADHLLYFLGRANVEAIAPMRLQPFLSTLEMFKLKWAAGPAEQEAYMRASLEEKRKILDRLAAVPASKVAFNGQPTLVGQVGWQISTRELCRLIYELKDNPILAVNPGLADKRDWFLAGFKGGSEPGALNYTHLLRKTATSPVYAVSVTINNPAKEVDTRTFTELTYRLIGLLERGRL